MRKSKWLLIILAAVFLMVGCSIPFEVATDTTTIELPTTGGLYFEKVIDVPADALRDAVTFDEIILVYTVRRTGAFTADVKLYASSDEIDDNLKDGGDELLISVNLGPFDSEKSGEVVSQTIKDVLNAKQAQFVVGAENLTMGPLATIYLDITLRAKGHYTLF